jgi:HAD superfamily hydrolase (TIGR01509 family)
MDGTLLDSERLWQIAQQDTMAYFGLTWTEADQAASIGGPLERVVRHIAARTGGEEGHIARILVAEIEHQVATSPAYWMPGAKQLLAEAKAAGVPTAVVSNSWRVLLDLLLLNMDLHPDVTVSSTEIERPKPDPQPFLVACSMLSARPASTWVVEDSPTGVRAGLAAGCWVLAVGPAIQGLQDVRLRTVATLDMVTLDALSV